MPDPLKCEIEEELEESRTEAITVKVTASTLRSLQLVAQINNCPVGPMLFGRSIRDIEREAAEIRAQVRPMTVA